MPIELQEHLHVGRPNWKRSAIDTLILFGGVIAPFVLGLHWRAVTFVANSSDNLSNYTGPAVGYKGLFSAEIYGVNSDQSPPLYILVGPVFSHRNIDGMKWLEEKK